MQCFETIFLSDEQSMTTFYANVASSYLEMLIRIGMIEKKDRLYITTRKGIKILPVMKNVQDAFTNSTGVHNE